MTDTFRRRNNQELPEIPNMITVVRSEITKTDVIQGIQSLINRKSPGEDQIPNELSKIEGSRKFPNRPITNPYTNNNK